MLRRLLLTPFVLLPLLGGCDMLGIESASQIAAAREADGKAVGGGCRQAGRAIEDCYALNRKVDKAAIYAGWREMDDYMRENKLATVTPVITPLDPRQRVASGRGAGTGDEAAADGAAATASAPDAAAAGRPHGTKSSSGKAPA